MKPADLQGKKVVLTGTFVTMKRDQAERLLTEAGAVIAGSISVRTDLLICGDNAGSKLAKAQSLGVPQMSEADLVALLQQTGTGAAQLAGASERLAGARASAPPESEVARAVAALRTFVETLKGRPDLTVTVASLGRRASKSDLSYLGGLKGQPGIPAELIELYAAMNGAHVEWRFVEPPGGGCLRIPPLSQWTRFTGDDQTYMGFGDDHEALLLDEIQPEGGTWLVRSKADGAVRLVFASAAEGRDGIEPAGSIAAYLRAAIDHGFVYYWPRCFRPNRYVSYAEQEDAVERFRAAPTRPVPIRVGARVQFGYFSEGGRGEVLSRHEAPAVRAAEFCGRRLAEVRLDEGSIAWLPEQWMKVHVGADAYERLRAPSFDLAAAAAADLPGLLADLARAIGPLAHYVGGMPSNARRAAGLLSARPLGEALAAVLDLYHAVRAARLDLAERRPLPKTGQEFSATDFARFGFEHTLDGTFTGLFDGLRLLSCHESARRGVAGQGLVDAALRQRVARVAAAAALSAALGAAEVLAAPSWSTDTSGEAAQALGLPAGAVLLQGTGL